MSKHNNTNLTATVIGHLLVKDDTGVKYVDKYNAVHPQNLARVWARALANESNYFIHRMAFGNGGTIINSAGRIEYKTPNDGQGADPAGWESTLYNETYSEIIDDSNVDIGTGIGANPSGDPTSEEHVSGPGVRSAEMGLTSQVVIEVVLNPGEPFGQDFTDEDQTDPNSDFTFDEIALFTEGLPGTQTSGYQDVNVSTKAAMAVTGLANNTVYTFKVQVNGGAVTTVVITTPNGGSGPQNEILYADLVELINNTPPFGATATISDPENDVNTFGFLRLVSNTTGPNSAVNLIDDGQPNFLFRALAGYVGLETPIRGSAAGVANDTISPGNERERMLTHITFSPVLKSSNRSLIITYTLTLSIARSLAE